MRNEPILPYVLIVLSLAISTYFAFNTKFLVPKGFDLAIDGYVISKTLMVIFTLYLLSKLGYYFITKKD
ncbi:hypothetical protein [Pseudobacillus badius]|uniref:hypothetical protein n=1 Tax=Bacillus badius TaxID=1455 RepID=UPI0024A56B19|nr:hypothetical protein [Bacillus badius]GLY12296.1 hypothetical protein Bbad01_35120 [Bacillus badius]